MYERDDYTCKNCGRRGGIYGDAELHAHHIVPKSNDGVHELDNLATLCSDCHRAVHGSSMAPTSSTPNDSTSFWSTLGEVTSEDIDEFIEQKGPDENETTIKKRGFLMVVSIMSYIFTYMVTGSIQTTVIVGFIISVPMLLYFGTNEPIRLK